MGAKAAATADAEHNHDAGDEDHDVDEDGTFASQATVLSRSKVEVTDLKNCIIYQKNNSLRRRP